MNLSNKRSDLQNDFDALHQAFQQSGGLTYRCRIARLKALSSVIRKRKEDFVKAISEDFGGRAREETLGGEVLPVVEEIRHVLSNLSTWMADDRRSVPWWHLPASARVVHQPLGVVGVLAPWNYPMCLAVGPLISAIAAGNRVLLKPSEYTPCTTDLLAETLGEVFTSDEVRVVSGDWKVGEAFSALPLDHLIFTGATEIGRKVMASASASLTPVTLELGGKSPVLIHDSYSMKSAADRVLLGKVWNAGQTCIAPDYVLCPKGKRDEFVQALRELSTTRYPRIKDSPGYTAVHPRHRTRIQQWVMDAKSQGGEVIELNPGQEDLTDSPRFPLFVVVNPTEEMCCMKEEIFGPILPVVTYETLDEAIAFINARPRPLALYYFDGNTKRGTEVRHRTRAGAMVTNAVLRHFAAPALPFGGVGESGLGAYHGQNGFVRFSHAQSVYRGGWPPVLPWVMRPPYGRLINGVLKLLIR